MKHIFIVNTTSYPLETLNLIERIIEICRSLKVNYNIRCVDSREKTIKLASTFKNENAIIYAVGGDGTVNAVLNGIVGGSAFLGIVPNGASNDLFRFLNESGNESTICNVMRVNDLYCLNIFSLGIDAEICENAEKMKKFDIPRGQIYNWSIAYTFFKHKDFPVLVKADEKNFYSPSMSMVAICNGKYCENGYPINPNACIENKGSNLIMVEALKKLKPESILILGTSDGMVEKIAENLGLEKPEKTIYINEVATETEMETAKRIRTTEGKHVIPVPTFEIKRDFAGYILDPLQIFKYRRNNEPYISEKSIIRPTFSYLGKFTISDTVFRQITEYVAKKTEGIHRVSKVRVENSVGATNIYVEVYVVFGYNIVNVLREFKQKVKKEIERLTTMNVQEVSVLAKGIHIPENKIK